MMVMVLYIMSQANFPPKIQGRGHKTDTQKKKIVHTSDRSGPHFTDRTYQIPIFIDQTNQISSSQVVQIRFPFHRSGRSDPHFTDQTDQTRSPFHRSKRSDPHFTDRTYHIPISHIRQIRSLLVDLDVPLIGSCDLDDLYTTIFFVREVRHMCDTASSLAAHVLPGGITYMLRLSTRHLLHMTADIAASING